MIVVSDASPLVALSRVARLEILRQLYGRVVVPDAVHAEFLAGEPEGGALGNLIWLERRAVSDPTIVSELAPVLDGRLGRRLEPTREAAPWAQGQAGVGGGRSRPSESRPSELDTEEQGAAAK